MEFFETAEKKEEDGGRNHDYSQEMGAQNGRLHSETLSYSSSDAEDHREEETKIPSIFPDPFGSPWQQWKSQVPLRSPPVADVKVAVISPSVSQPKISSASKKGPLFSVSAFYDPSGHGHLQQAGAFKGIESFLRMAAAVFSLIACCVMTSARETRVAAGSTFEVKFSDFQAYNYLVALNVLAFAYSSAQVVMILQSSSSSSRSSSTSVFSSPIRSGICKYLCDEILAFCLFSASSSAATASQLAYHGLHNIWPPACSTWKLWMLCSKVNAAIVISFFSSLSVILSSLLSGAQLLQLAALV